MANQDLLKILKQGIEAWNKWQKEHPKAEINFKEAKLWGADLREADLSGFQEIQAYEGSEIPKEFQKNWIFMERELH